MDSIDGNYYFTCITNGCHVGGPHKISKNLVRLETERQLKHTVVFHNIRSVYRPKAGIDVQVNTDVTFHNGSATKLGN